MVVERYVSKRTIWIIFSVVTILSAVTIYLGTYHRFELREKYKDYIFDKADVISLEKYEHEDSDDDTYYRYSAVISYKIGNSTYTQMTGEVFSEDNVPDKGDRVPVLYCEEKPNDYVLAEYDWMTHSYLPLDNNGDGWIFTGLILVSIAMLLCGVALDTEQAQGILIGSGLFLMGADGIVMGILCKNPTMFLLIIFGAVGAYILYRFLLVPKERRKKEEQAAESLRLFKVIDMYVDIQTNIKTVVFSMSENNGTTNELFSYDDISNRYNLGDMYQIDKTVLRDFWENRLVNGLYTININGLSEEHIQPLNPLFEKILSHI